MDLADDPDRDALLGGCERIHATPLPFAYAVHLRRSLVLFCCSLPFTLLSDPDRAVMEAWGAYGDKMMYGKKTKGVIRSTVWVGPDGTVRKHWARVADAAKHPVAVLEMVTSA